MGANYSKETDVPTEARSLFLMVRSHACLERANKEAAAHLSILRSHSPAGEFGTLQGIWVDENSVQNLPIALELPKVGDKKPTDHSVTAMGVNGIWMLCWLETAIGTVSRVDLVSALLEKIDRENSDTTSSSFIPVVAEGEPGPRLSDELQMLETRYPQLVQSPVPRSDGGSLLRLWATPGPQVAPS